MPSRFDDTKCVQDQSSVSNTADESKYPQLCYQCGLKTCGRCSANAECFRKMPVNPWLQQFQLSMSAQMTYYFLALRIQCFCAQFISIAELFTSPCSQFIILLKGLQILEGLHRQRMPSLAPGTAASACRSLRQSPPETRTIPRTSLHKQGKHPPDLLSVIASVPVPAALRSSTG